MMRNRIPLVLLSFIVVVVSSCLFNNHPSPPLVLALVNGEAIKEDLFRVRLNLEKSQYGQKAFEEADSFRELKKGILGRLVENRIIAQWGRKNNMVLSPNELAHGLESLKQGYTEREFEMMLEEKKLSYSAWRQMAEESLMVDKVLKKELYDPVKITQGDMSQYYREHSPEFQVGERVRVRHIVTDSPEKALKLRERLMQGENFAKLAIMHSLSPDRSNGGDLGSFSRGSHPREFDVACFMLTVGEISQVVKSPYGYHIFKLIDRKPKGVLPLEEVGPRIHQQLLRKKAAEKFFVWYEGIKAQSQVQIFEAALKKIKP